MVTTRNKRPVAAGDAPSDELAHLSSINTRLGEPSLSHDGAADQATPAKSSRSRKRRRTGSPPLDGAQPMSKRSNVRKPPSPETKRLHNAAGSLSELSKSAGEALHLAPSGEALEGYVNNGPVVAAFLQDPETNGPSSLQAERRQRGPGAKPSPRTQMSQTLANADPDYAKIIGKIIDHGESVENQYASRNLNPEGLAIAENLLGLGSSQQLQKQSLPILDNLAIQMLNTFARSGYQEILTLTTDVNSDQGGTYATLKSLFDHTKKVYSIHDPFISAQGLGLVERSQSDIIRKANLATFVSSVFGSHDVGFYHLNENFLDIFISDGNRLLKSQAGLLLDLKTQAYISAIASGERSREDILRDLFPPDLEARILSRRPGAKQATPSEADFIQRAHNRSKALMEEPLTAEAIAQLPEKYVWEDFLRDICTFVSKNFSAIAGSSTRKPRAGRSSNVFITDQHQPSPRSQQPQKPRQVQSNFDPSLSSPNVPSAGVAQMVPNTGDIAEKAARAAQIAMQNFDMSQGGTGQQDQNRAQQQMQQSPQQQQYQYQFDQQPSTPYYNQNQFQSNEQIQQPQIEANEAQGSYPDPNAIPFPTQSAPTQVLYERARMAATAKASPANRRAGHPSQRRPWSTEEENALMAGLDRVKGPHWSQILAMFGPGGTVNETLKDRNQVQLKDKARNLKLFFLKSGIEVPYYLQFVTGELKTRAPGASKREAKARAAKDEAEAEGDTSMAIDGGGQNDGQAAGGAEENDAAMEDGEGEIIDPVEYAAVHGAGSDHNSKIDPQLSNERSSAVDQGNIEQQLFQAATAHMNGGTNPSPRNARGNATHGPQVAIMTSGPHATS
ncbi:MAG: hypothetical protein Q9167_007227 [Letrouitia subvulpina]